MADTLGPVATIIVPVGSLTLGPFTRLDLPVGPTTLGPLVEIVVWGGHPKLLRTDQLRSPLIGVLRSANMNTTADQLISISAKRFVVRRIVATGGSTPISTAVGGIYTGAGKTGTAIVPANQTYAALSSSTKFLDLGQGLLTTTDSFTSGALYLSLTTPQGADATADIYVYGDSVES